MPCAARQFLTAVAASRAAGPSMLCPQPCPWPPGSTSLGSAMPATWERPGRASYSPSHHRPAIAGLAHDGRGDAGEVLGNAEALLLQHSAVLGHRTVPSVADL